MFFQLNSTVRTIALDQHGVLLRATMYSAGLNLQPSLALAMSYLKIHEKMFLAHFPVTRALPHPGEEHAI